LRKNQKGKNENVIFVSGILTICFQALPETGMMDFGQQLMTLER
jgi:hypothetical protein